MLMEINKFHYAFDIEYLTLLSSFIYYTGSLKVSSIVLEKQEFNVVTITSAFRTIYLYLTFASFKGFSILCLIIVSSITSTIGELGSYFCPLPTRITSNCSFLISIIRLTITSAASLEGAHTRSLGLAAVLINLLDIKVKIILQITLVFPVPGGPIIKPTLAFEESILKLCNCGVMSALHNFIGFLFLTTFVSKHSDCTITIHKHPLSEFLDSDKIEYQMLGENNIDFIVEEYSDGIIFTNGGDVSTNFSSCIKIQ
ncbi:hypothetical protein AGLY_016271 [Aphis glycines]|uniref:Uncharacterized protein n=1 Tax=Aphis glycines TaxID=307491 RepID=A0A6G0SY76_APHGL|nr:hypothetical protein AGLY_016271 [Aphis glycines]